MESLAKSFPLKHAAMTFKVSSYSMHESNIWKCLLSQILSLLINKQLVETGTSAEDSSVELVKNKTSTIYVEFLIKKMLTFHQNFLTVQKH